MTQATVDFNNKVLLESLSTRLGQEPTRIAEAKKEGKKVVGYFCPHVPEELILAAGMLPVRLTFGGELEAVTAGEDFLKSYSCPFARSCLGHKKLSDNFYYTAVDAICVAYTCDSMRRIQEYWEKYFGIPTFSLGVPQTHDRFRSKPHAIEYFKNELKLLRQKLAEFSGTTVTDQDLRKAIALCNKIRERLWLLFEYPQNRQTPIEWRDVLSITHAGFLLERADFIVEIDQIIKELKKIKQGDLPQDTRPRIMIAGSIIGIGDQKLLDIIKQAGANIVADSTCTGSMFSRKRVSLPGIIGSPIDGLAERYLYNIPCPFMTDLPKRLNRMIRIARDYAVQGLIYYNLKYCDIWRAEFKFIKDALYKELSVPSLLIETDYSPTDIGTIRTKVEAFLEMIGDRV
ncbi:MAG: 2-hydroxyacyl-CoA dehydratase [Dehalococcoidia bacterium]|nr:MAG: 2-hydroxyacyl-CoA dehydratase [Dehalococcoidia bacterium]